MLNTKSKCVTLAGETVVDKPHTPHQSFVPETPVKIMAGRLKGVEVNVIARGVF